MAKDTDFLYISARIKFLETKLLGRNAIERILEAPTADEAIKVLGDTEYGNDMLEMENIYDFENVLEQSMLRTIKVLKESFDNHEFIRFFTLKSDYHNLKVVIKANILGTGNNNYYSILGEVPHEEIEKYAQGDMGANVPDNLKDSYSKTMEIYEITKDPQQVDLTLDKFLFEEMSKIVDITRDPFLKEYLTALSDLTNIKTIIRLKKVDAHVKTLESAMLTGGNLTNEFFKENFSKNKQELVEALGSTPYQQLVDEGINQWELTGSPSVFEKMMDDYLISLAKKGLYKPFGPETVVGYMAARENEMKILRIILVGKINGISTDMIRERLRDVYV